MDPKDDTSNFVRLLEKAIPDKHRDKAEILHIARQLVGANDYVEEMSDPVVLRAVHLYRKHYPDHGQSSVPLPVLIRFLRTRLGLQEVDELERRMEKIRDILATYGQIDVLQRVQVNPWDFLAMRVLAGFNTSWIASATDKDEPKSGDTTYPET